jgi:hypothetical protein
MSVRLVIKINQKEEAKRQESVRVIGLIAWRLICLEFKTMLFNCWVDNRSKIKLPLAGHRTSIVSGISSFLADPVGGGEQA